MACHDGRESLRHRPCPPTNIFSWAFTEWPWKSWGWGKNAKRDFQALRLYGDKRQQSPNFSGKGAGMLREICSSEVECTEPHEL